MRREVKGEKKGGRGEEGKGLFACLLAWCLESS